ncbi:hypothetical protein [Chryseobacterium tongliaoense]|uniref:hypothetical protein n=1 Tax=Chryseobacterium tongliaoense TaxID=3240933 RepID=UPI003515B315
MKNFFSFLAFLLIPFFHAQDLKDFIVPEGYTRLSETKGDLDKDGKNEVVILLNTKNKKDTEGYQRVLYILKNSNGKLKIWKENFSIIFPSDYGFYPENNELPEITIKNNCLIISQQFNTNSRHTQTYTHTFRFQNNDFFLIGSVSKFDDTCEFNILNEINFSTGKVIVDEQYFPCADGEAAPAKNFYKEFKYPFKTLTKMNNFTVGENSYKIPNSDKYFNF